MKQCTKCKKDKDLSEFYKDKHTKDKLSYNCKICCKIKSELYTKSNKQRVAEYQASYRKDNLEELKHYLSVYTVDYYKKNKEKVDSYQAQYRNENKEKVAARIASWGKSNPGKRNAITAKYRAKKLQATPKWLTEEQLIKIQNIYIEAARFTKETGISYHVDHITPLQGENVSGLHVPWNLQILQGIGPNGNLSKGNKVLE